MAHKSESNKHTRRYVITFFTTPRCNIAYNKEHQARPIQRPHREV